MVELGLHLSSEDHDPATLVRAARAAEDAGIRTVTISDHYHPWHGEQGSSPFVWSVIGGIAATTTRLRVVSAVTCPTMRIHPAVIAQAAATSAVMLDGRFILGVGSGENLNEHVLGDRWPEAPVRLEMLAEAIEVMRLLWQGGEHSHRGRHYTVENARIWNLPDGPVPVYVSAFGPKAMELAVEHGDGYVGTSPDADLVRRFREGSGDKPRIAAAKCSWDRDAITARGRIHHRWPNLGLPGQLAQELPTTTMFEQAAELVDEETAVGEIPHGPDPGPYAAAVRTYKDAGYGVVCLHHIGDDQVGFVDFLTTQVRPLLG